MVFVGSFKVVLGTILLLLVLTIIRNMFDLVANRKSSVYKADLCIAY